MSFRHCFSSLPEYLQDLPQGPRQGSLNREGFEPAADAAGHPFPEGESCGPQWRDPRVLLTVDRLQSKRKDCLSSFDSTGAAGICSPRTEIRCLTIDDNVRRARSAPPRPQSSLAAMRLSMQIFGVQADLGSLISSRRRSISVNPQSTSRAQIARHAMQYGYITDVLAKKHFHGEPAPLGYSSPRLAAVDLENIDIDARAGRARPAPQAPSEGILPWNSPSNDIYAGCGEESFTSRPRTARSLKYFEIAMESERYAKLIGRPHEKTEKELRGKRLAIELERQDKLADKCDDAAWSATKDDLRSKLSMRSTTASEGSGTPSESEATEASNTEPKLRPRSLLARSRSPTQSLSQKSRSKFNLNISESVCDEGDEDDVWGVPHRRQTPPPMAVRRVMASVMPNIDLPQELMADLQAALQTAALDTTSQRSRQQRRYGASPPRPRRSTKWQR